MHPCLLVRACEVIQPGTGRGLVSGSNKSERTLRFQAWMTGAIGH
jgi:hypothetical protein